MFPQNGGLTVCNRCNVRTISQEIVQKVRISYPNISGRGEQRANTIRIPFFATITCSYAKKIGKHTW